MKGYFRVNYKAFYSRFNIALFTCLLLLTLSGCAVHGDEEPFITVSPDSAVITLGGTKGFSVAPAGTAVTWSVNGIPGGNEDTVGTVDTAGIYTAPADAEAAPEKVVVSAADTSGSSASSIAFLTTFGTNKGLTTYTAGNSSSNTYSSGQKNIAVFKESDTVVNVYAVWSDNSSGVYKVYFAKSSDGGSSFDVPILIDDTSLGEQFSPAIAADGNGDIFIVWEDRGQGDADILLRKYDSATQGFESINQINLDTIEVTDYDTTPSIAISSEEIYVVWEHREDISDDYPDIYFARSSNHGSTFPDRTYLSLAGRRPAVAMDSGGVAYVVWEDLGEELEQFPDIPTQVKLRKISGGTPGDTLDIEVASGYNARFPSIAVDPICNTTGDSICDLYVVYQRALISNAGFGSEVVNSYNIDLTIIDGETLDIIKPAVIVPDSGSTGIVANKAYPAVAADDSTIYIVWDDLSGETKNVFFTKSSDGENFTTNRIVNDDIGNNSSGVSWHEKPGIAVANGRAYVIWTDYRNIQLSTNASSSDVYFAVEQ